MDVKKNQTKTISHKKVENGYVVTLRVETESKKGWDSTSKQYVTKTAVETQNLIKDLVK